MTSGNHWRLIGWGAAAALLLAPAVAMQVTDEVAWDWFDFAVMGALLLGVGGAFEFLARRSGSPWYRAGAALALLGAFLLVWIDGAVGIVGSERNGANLMFLGVLAVGGVGAMVTQCRAAGLARALVATAAAQVVAGAIALGGDLGAGSPSWPWDVTALTAGFTALWLATAALFVRAARVSGSRATAA